MATCAFKKKPFLRQPHISAHLGQFSKHISMFWKETLFHSKNDKVLSDKSHT